MKVFENKVGRPSNETIAKRKKIKIMIASIVVALIAVISGLVYKTFFSISPIEGGGLEASVSKTKFIVQNNSNNCYTIYSPTDAKNWRVQVYYKKSSALAYGSNKFIQYNHYNDNVKSQKICLTKQKNNQETYRILVKWTKGANDSAYTKVKVKDWKPSGWNHNGLTGWAYTDVKVDWSKVNTNTNNNNTNTNTNQSVVSNDITYTLKGTNGSIIVNGKQYQKGTTVSSAVIRNNYVFGNANGKTNIDITVTFTKSIYNYTKPNAKSGEETKNLFKIVTYDKNNKVVSDSGLTKITAVTHNKTVTIKQNVTSIKLLIYAPGRKTMEAGSLLREFKINATILPTITTITTGERIPSSQGYYWDSFTTYGEKFVTFTVNNPNDLPFYGRWMTYPTYEETKPGYMDPSCTAISKTHTRKPSLGINSTLPKRKGVYKVFPDKASCDKNSGEIVSSTVWYEYSKTYTTDNGFVQISNLMGANNNPIMKAIKPKIQTTSMCYEYALAYGSMILRNTTTSPKIVNNKKYGADINKRAKGAKLVAVIKEQIDKGIPVMIHTKHASSQHWILVVGYKANASNETIANNLTTHLHVIDPYGVKENGTRVVKIATIKGGAVSKQWQHSDNRYLSWSSASKAKA